MKTDILKPDPANPNRLDAETKAGLASALAECIKYGDMYCHAKPLCYYDGMKTQPLPGETYDRLTVEAQDGRRGTAMLYRCRCVCGKILHVSAGDLRRWRIAPRHRTMSCGCSRGQSVREGRFNAGLCTRGGKANRKEYQTWRGMLERCNDQKRDCFKNYGGRGITVCARWADDFDAFLSDMGRCPENYTIERIDNDGPYSPENCKWASRMEQGANTRKCRMLTLHGETHHMSEWARRFGMSAGVLKHRIDHQEMSLEKALTTPVGQARFSSTRQPAR